MPNTAAKIQPLANGVLTDTDITRLFAGKQLTTQTPLVEGQIQPASLDLRLGTKAYRIQAGFLPAATAR